MTNAEKFKEVFGFELKNIGRYEDGYYCIDSDADIECKTCPLYEKGCSHVAFINWWNSKYQGEPTKTDLISKEEALMALTGVNLPTDRDKLIALFDKRIKALVTVEAVSMSVIEKIHDAVDNADSDGFLINENGHMLAMTLTKEHVNEIIDQAIKECDT